LINRITIKKFLTFRFISIIKSSIFLDLYKCFRQSQASKPNTQRRKRLWMSSISMFKALYRSLFAQKTRFSWTWGNCLDFCQSKQRKEKSKRLWANWNKARWNSLRVSRFF